MKKYRNINDLCEALSLIEFEIPPVKTMDPSILMAVSVYSEDGSTKRVNIGFKEDIPNNSENRRYLSDVYSDRQTPFARAFRPSFTEGEIHPHGS